MYENRYLGRSFQAVPSLVQLNFLFIGTRLNLNNLIWTSSQRQLRLSVLRLVHTISLYLGIDATILS